MNAANHSLLRGGGVDGAIHTAAGAELQAACKKLPPITPNSDIRCKTGDAKIIAINWESKLPKSIKHIILTVGPKKTTKRRTPKANATLLKQCYINSLESAQEKGIETIAFPAISAGAYGFTIKESVQAAMAAVQEHAQKHPNCFKEIRLVISGKTPEHSQQNFNSAVQTIDVAIASNTQESST